MDVIHKANAASLKEQFNQYKKVKWRLYRIFFFLKLDPKVFTSVNYLFVFSSLYCTFLFFYFYFINDLRDEYRAFNTTYTYMCNTCTSSRPKQFYDISRYNYCSCDIKPVDARGKSSLNHYRKFTQDKIYTYVPRSTDNQSSTFGSRHGLPITKTL